MTDIRNTSYTHEELEKIMNNNTKLHGIVARCDHASNLVIVICRKYGITKSIHFPMTTLTWSQRKKLRVGMKIAFYLTEKDGRYIPCQCELTENKALSTKPVLILDTGERILPRYILKYGYGNAMNMIMKKTGVTAKEIREHGYTRSDFNYIYIHTNQHDYKIFQNSSPVKGDAKIENLEEFYNHLNQTMLNCNDERDSKIQEQRKEQLQNIEKKIPEIKMHMVRFGLSPDLAEYLIREKTPEKVLIKRVPIKAAKYITQQNQKLIKEHGETFNIPQ